MVSNFDAKIRKKAKYARDSEDTHRAGSTDNGVARFRLISCETHVFHHAFSPKLDTTRTLEVITRWEMFQPRSRGLSFTLATRQERFPRAWISYTDRYQMMRDCWMEKAEDRPNFAALVQRLENTIASNMPAMVSGSLAGFR